MFSNICSFTLDLPGEMINLRLENTFLLVLTLLGLKNTFSQLIKLRYDIFMTSRKSNMFSSLLRCGFSTDKSRIGPILFGTFLYLHIFLFFTGFKKSFTDLSRSDMLSIISVTLNLVHALVKLNVAFTLSSDSFG